MTATNFNTENRTYRQLLGNGLTYRIPRFQRDYSWGQEEWEDLWADIDGALREDGEQAHYMGYLVLQTDNNRIFEVIDGQQRLTTVSLIVLAAMRQLKELVATGVDAVNNQRRLDGLRASYIGYIDNVTLTARNKLTLNRNNDAYYRDYLAELAEHLPQRGFVASTHALRKGFEWFFEKLRAYIKGRTEPGMALAQFVETLSDKLFFTVITVTDEINAYKVFETLNARGVRLSTTDLLKNYLFSVLARGNEAQHELDDLERRWEGMVGRLGNESLPDFLRMHWNSRETYARQAELFKVIRKRIDNRGAVFALLRAMDEDIDTYLALNQPEGSAWPAEWRASAQELRMFSVRQPFPMLMAAKRKLSNKDFGDLLRATVVIAFRYSVIGGEPTNEQERVLHAAAIQLHNDKVSRLYDLLPLLKPVYRGDDAFRADFAERGIKTTNARNTKIVRYILAAIEKQIGGAEVDPDSSDYTIEHVLPQRPDAGWEVFPDRDLEQFVYRIGNMTLLEAPKNKTCANRPYVEKRPLIQSSALMSARKLAEDYGDWSPETISTRQRAMARIATGIWRITQLS
jgi:hypothetical protein